MSTAKLFKNINTTVAQIIITSLTYFWLYRHLAVKLGVAEIGLLSLVLAFTSLASVGSFGLNSGIVRFVAIYNEEGKHLKIEKLIKTSFLFLLVFFSSFELLLYFIINAFLPVLIDNNLLATAKSLIPFSLLSLLLITLSGVFSSVLEAIQKNYIKNYIYISTSVLFVCLVIVFLPHYGIKGVVIAQVLQSFVILIVSAVFAIRKMLSWHFYSWKFDVKTFKEIFRFTAKFQALSIVSICFEPITKFLVTFFSGGNLLFLGYYEMANRLVTQVRLILVNSNQVLIPIIISRSLVSKEEDGLFLRKAFAFNLTISTCIISLLLIAIPSISLIWLGTYETTFIYLTLLLSAGYLLNIYSGIVFFNFIAKAKMGILFWNQLLLGSINLFGGLLLGRLIGVGGPIWAWSIGLGISALLLMYKQFQLEKTLYQVISNSRKIFLLAGVLLSAVIPIVVNAIQRISLLQNLMLLSVGIVLIMVLGIMVLKIDKPLRLKHFLPFKRTLT